MRTLNKTSSWISHSFQIVCVCRSNGHNIRKWLGRNLKEKTTENYRHFNNKCNSLQTYTNAICKNTRYIRAHFNTERNAIRLQFWPYSAQSKTYITILNPINEFSSQHTIFCIYFSHLFIWFEVDFDSILFSRKSSLGPRLSLLILKCYFVIIFIVLTVYYGIKTFYYVVCQFQRRRRRQ